jgi:hypothetical protein
MQGFGLSVIAPSKVHLLSASVNETVSISPCAAGNVMRR